MSGVVCDVLLRYDVYQNATVHLHLFWFSAPALLPVYQNATVDLLFDQFPDYLPSAERVHCCAARSNMSRSDWMLPGGSVFVKPLDRKAPGRSATQTMKDVEALNEFARSEPP